MHPYSRKPSAHRAVATSLLPTWGAVGSRQTHPNLECSCIDPRLLVAPGRWVSTNSTLPPCRSGHPPDPSKSRVQVHRPPPFWSHLTAGSLDVALPTVPRGGACQTRLFSTRGGSPRHRACKPW